MGAAPQADKTMQDHNRDMKAGSGVLRVLLAVFAAAAAPPAPAEVYRCVVGGVTQFSDRPCQAGDAPLAVPQANVMPADRAAAPLAEQHDRRVQAGREARDAEDAAWRQDHEARTAEAERLRAARVRGEVVRGMSAADVRRLLGTPTKIDSDRDARGLRERWSYADSGAGRVTVTLRDGVVSDVRRSRRK